MGLREPGSPEREPGCEEGEVAPGVEKKLCSVDACWGRKGVALGLSEDGDGLPGGLRKFG